MTDLTEQWKKGELKKNKYWVKYKNGKIDTWELSEGITIESKPEIIEILAPVQSYQEYLESESHCAVYSEVNKSLKEKNQQLKELLKECVSELSEFNNSCYPKTQALITKIDNAIGEKK